MKSKIILSQFNLLEKSKKLPDLTSNNSYQILDDYRCGFEDLVVCDIDDSVDKVEECLMYIAIERNVEHTFKKFSALWFNIGQYLLTEEDIKILFMLYPRMFKNWDYQIHEKLSKTDTYYFYYIWEKQTYQHKLLWF